MHYRPFEKPWYVRRSIENNPLNRINVSSDLEGVVSDVSTNGNYSDNNRGLFGYISRIAGNIFSVVPAPVKRMVAISGVAGLLYLGTACGGHATPTPSPTNTPAPTPTATLDLALTKIAFVKWLGSDKGGGEIYIINGDGSNEKRLTNARCADMNPVWSPNGEKIAFESYRHGNSDIYVMNADGSNQIRLTSSSKDDQWPSWSPEGNEIVYSSGDEDSRAIYAMNADGSNKRFLDNGSRPAWSPKGDKIAYGSGNHAIYIINSDGTNTIRIADDTLHDFSWSPDGKYIAFTERDPKFGGFIVYLVNSDGSNIKALTHNARNSRDTSLSPSWSPDGKYIAFVRSRDGDRDYNSALWIVSADGKFSNQVTPQFKDVGIHPVWASHGNVIAVVTDLGIYTVNSDGTNWTLRTDNNYYGRNRMFSWSPITYPQGLEAIVVQEQIPKQIPNNPQAHEAYAQSYSILKNTKSTREEKQKELRVLQNTLGEELVTEVMRHIPIYDGISGEFVSFDAYMQSIAGDYGEFTGAPIEKDPVGAGMRIFFDTSPETIKAMLGIDKNNRSRVSDRSRVSAEFKCKE